MLIIFDLDGTLIDSAKDLELSVNETRKHLGLGPLESSLIRSYIGNGASMLIRRAMGPDASDELVKAGLQFFLEFYGDHALENTRLYPGVGEVIADFWSAQHDLAVLTNKPAKISIDILAACGIQKYFFRIYGGDSLDTKKPDPQGILRLMQEVNRPRTETLMVGDSAVDILTARNAGVSVCGVAWGIQPQSFETDPPDFVIHDPRELASHLS